MSEIKAAWEAGVLSKEAVGFFWAKDFIRANKRPPSIQIIRAGVEAEFGEMLTHPTAGRALYKAKRQIFRQARLKD